MVVTFWKNNFMTRLHFRLTEKSLKCIPFCVLTQHTRILDSINFCEIELHRCLMQCSKWKLTSAATFLKSKTRIYHSTGTDQSRLQYPFMISIKFKYWIKPDTAETGIFNTILHSYSECICCSRGSKATEMHFSFQIIFISFYTMLVKKNLVNSKFSEISNFRIYIPRKKNSYKFTWIFQKLW
jgi:hypothetical protein